MDNKTFHAIKSNNRTRTRVSQKIGWLAEGNTYFLRFSPSPSLFLFSVSGLPSLFLSSLGHDIDRTANAKG